MQRLMTIVTPAVLLMGCATSRQVDPVAAAHSALAQGYNEESRSLARVVLSSSAVDGVQPWYEVFPSKIGPKRGRLLGAVVHVQSIPGATPEALEAALRCDCAERLLHSAKADVAGAREPFCLPNTWVDIEVAFDRHGYLVLARAGTADRARLLLEHTEQFARERATRHASFGVGEGPP